MKKSLRDRLRLKIRRLSPELRPRAEASIEELERKCDLTVAALERLILDSHAEASSRSAAAWVSGLLREQTLIPALKKVLLERSPLELVWEAAKSLTTMATDGEIFHHMLLESKDSEVRRVAVYALGILRDVTAVETLCNILLNPNEPPSLRGQAAETLGCIGTEASVEPLLAATRAEPAEVRFWSVFALGRIGDMRAIPVLQELAAHDHAVVEDWWEISKEARDALDEIRGAPS